MYTRWYCKCISSLDCACQVVLDSDIGSESTRWIQECNVRVVWRKCRYIGKVVICPEFGSSKSISATADTKEFVEINWPLDHHSLACRSISDLHNCRDSLVGG